jgi:hypothetical protein
MALSSTTSPASTTRRWMSSRRLHQDESPFPRTFSHETSPNRLSTSLRPPRVGKNPQGLPRILWVRNPWTRTPQTRCSCSPCSRGYGVDEARPWRPRCLPCGGLADQIPRLDRSRGASLGSDRGQAHRQEGPIIHHD